MIKDIDPFVLRSWLFFMLFLLILIIIKITINQ